MADYVTCKYCGIVPRGHKCPHKTYKKKAYDTEADRFRKSKRWTNKSIEVRQRDRYLCRVCEANLYNTVQQFNYNELDVHHIEKLNDIKEIIKIGIAEKKPNLLVPTRLPRRKSRTIAAVIAKRIKKIINNE